MIGCIVGMYQVTARQMAHLDAKERKELPKSDFAVPDKAPGSGSYPIEDKAHAKDALARSSGKTVMSKVIAAVHKKFPGLAQSTDPAHHAKVLKSMSLDDPDNDGDNDDSLDTDTDRAQDNAARSKQTLPTDGMDAKRKEALAKYPHLAAHKRIPGKMYSKP